MSIQQHRPLFPPEKRVSFRTPLDEEITTTKYTLAHSDISDPEPAIDSVSADSDSSAATTPRPSSPTPTQTPSLLAPPQLEKPVLVLPQLDFTFSAPLPTSSPPRSRPHRRDNSTSSPLLLCPRARPHKRDSSTSSDGSEASLASSDSDNSIANTPIAGRSKRCKWTWTLGPLPGELNPSEDFIESREGSVEIESLVCSPVEPRLPNSSVGEVLQTEEQSATKSEGESAENMDVDSRL